MEQAVQEFEDESKKEEEELAKIPKYEENVQKYLLINRNNMQACVDEMSVFSRHLGGYMSKMKESEDKRVIVKVQRPQIGDGMCLINNRDKSYGEVVELFMNFKKKVKTRFFSVFM